MIDDLITRGHTWKRAAVPPPKIHVKRETLAEIPAILRESQVLHTKTGAAQAAAVFTAEGRLIVCREDIGRHNALDKAIGHLLIAKMDIRDKVLVLSGPVTYELMAKAYHSGFSVVCALAEPTSLAVAIAEKGDITLIGSLAAKGMTIYAHPERVT
jgi:FdhD protein